MRTSGGPLKGEREEETAVDVVCHGNTITIQAEIHNEKQVGQDGIQVDNLEFDIINPNSEEPCALVDTSVSKEIEETGSVPGKGTGGG